MNSTFMWLFAVFLAASLQSQGSDKLAAPKLDAHKSKSTAKQSLSASHVRMTYINYCTHCHGNDGRPTSLVERVMPEIPDFSLYDWDDYNREDVMESIAEGVGKMPGFKKILDKSEIEAMAVLIAKFPSGMPFSLIEKTSRYRKVDAVLVEKFASLEEKLRDIRTGATDSTEIAETQ